jgi:protein SCO1
MRLASRLLCLAALFSPMLPAQAFGRPPALRNIGIDQHLNAQVPLDLEFKDESGKAVRLGSFIHDKPVVLSLVYYRCPMLCNLVLNGSLHAMRNIPLKLGRDYEAITVSFDPNETPQLATEKKATYVERFGSSEASTSWHFLTGKEAEIKRLASAVGFRYSWDDLTKQWVHASGIMVLTPEGRVSRYLYGIEYPKQDLRLALVESSKGKIGSRVDQILLFCFHYDPAKGKYGLAILNTLKAAGSATVLLLGVFVITMLRRDFAAGRRP